jgi:hypothetical protein
MADSSVPHTGAPAVHVDRISGHERWGKERKALDVVPVHVAKKEVHLHRQLAEELLAEATESRTAVKHEDAVAAANFHAARVAADPLGGRTR